MAFERPQLIRDEVYQHLRSQIMRGEILPGERIAEIELGERLGVSRTPIREALQRLVQERFLESSANKSVRVRTITAKEAKDAYQVREVLDGLAAHMAALNHSPENARELHNALAVLQAQGSNYENQVFLDLAFHRSITESTHNTALQESMASLERTIALIKHMTRIYNADPQTDIQHQGIVQAILSRDADTAKQRAEEHVRTFAERIVSDLANL